LEFKRLVSNAEITEYYRATTNLNFRKKGFRFPTTKGSHVRMKDSENRVVIIPVHANKVLGKGLFLKILRDAEISKEEIIDLLE
jgi:predicted RNA binding protein YcfA (HicA-like mRNA interferase family)